MPTIQKVAALNASIKKTIGDLSRLSSTLIVFLSDQPGLQITYASATFNALHDLQNAADHLTGLEEPINPQIIHDANIEINACLSTLEDILHEDEPILKALESLISETKAIQFSITDTPSSRP